MTVSALINSLILYKKEYGNRMIKYIGVADENVLFEEDITTIKICDNNANEPVIFCGDSYHELVSEPLIKLNWLGRILRPFIIEPVKNK